MAIVTVSKTYDRSAEEIWKIAGGFQSLDTWHPAIASVKELDGGARRQLTLADGGTILESLGDHGDFFYTYRIDESPLPITNYESTLRAKDAAGGSVLEWSATFEPNGVPEADAVALVEGIYQAGLDNI